MTSYGVVVAIAAFLSGALCAAIAPFSLGMQIIGSYLSSFLLPGIGGLVKIINLSAHVPTTPLIVAFSEGETGNALAVLNFGAGLGAFVGPAIVAALVGPFGYGAVAYALAGLYVISFFLLFFLKLPGGARVLHGPAGESDPVTES